MAGTMAVKTEISRLCLDPGSTVTISAVKWSEFELILQELGEDRSSRVAYSQNTLEIMVPLPDHERSKVLISDIVKILLRSQNRDWESLGSTTFRSQIKVAGLEPNDCFYIQHYQAVIGKSCLDLASDPPPDLAIESDYTSKTKLDAYLALRIPELWVYDRGLTIYVLTGDRYVESDKSPLFPAIALPSIVAHVIAQAQQIGSSRALRAFEETL